MKQLPFPPATANERALASEYRETFTGLTGPTITLAYPPVRTVDDVALELVFKNGTLLDGAAGGAASITREQFTGVAPALFFTLANTPSVGSELVFRNGELLDSRAAKTAAVSVTTSISAAVKESKLQDFTGGTSATLTLSHSADSTNCLVFKNGALLHVGTDYTVFGTTVTLSGAPIAGDQVLAWYQWATTTSGSGTGTQTLTVDPAPGTYTIDATTKKITPSVAPVSGDVFTVWYSYGAGATGTAGYTIDGAVLTLATDLVATDTVVVLYPYRQ